jgi:hypothetical protein
VIATNCRFRLASQGMTIAAEKNIHQKFPAGVEI